MISAVPCWWSQRNSREKHPAFAPLWALFAALQQRPFGSERSMLRFCLPEQCTSEQLFNTCSWTGHISGSRSVEAKKRQTSHLGLDSDNLASLLPFPPQRHSVLRVRPAPLLWSTVSLKL